VRVVVASRTFGRSRHTIPLRRAQGESLPGGPSSKKVVLCGGPGREHSSRSVRLGTPSGSVLKLKRGGE
jgi:hypothetical protein